jgi:arginine decarboxylase
MEVTEQPTAPNLDAVVVHVELPMQASVVFVVGLGDTSAALRRLAGDVDEVVKRLSEPGATAAIVPPAASRGNEVAPSPREAFPGEAEQVPADAAAGRISCESIASCPPGARSHGACDPAFQTINVLVGAL